MSQYSKEIWQTNKSGKLQKTNTICKGLASYSMVQY